MKEEIARRWVEELDKYPKGEGVLCSMEKGKPVGFCCLGVLSEMAVRSGVEIEVWEGMTLRHYGSGTTFLPPEVKEWSGMRTSSGDFEGNCLTAVNDESDDWETVKKAILEHWEEL